LFSYWPKRAPSSSIRMSVYICISSTYICIPYRTSTYMPFAIFNKKKPSSPVYRMCNK
jgi:hypothetical protein